MATYLTIPAPVALPSHKQGFSPREDISHQVHHIAQHFLTSFELACRTGDGKAFASLFAKEGFWRDMMAFTGDYRSISSANIQQAAEARFPVVGANDFTFTSTDPGIPSLQNPFEDVTFLNFHFTFSTNLGPCYGVANLIFERGEWKAYTVMTLLEGIHGHPARVGADRARGSHNDKMSYDARREQECEFIDRDPEVLIIGGGHNGLALAAQLNAIGVDNLVIDKQSRVGDNWRLRYKSLSLHDPVYANHLPYFPFPSNWPIFTPAGKLANFLEAYVDALEINVWSKTTTVPSTTFYDPSTKKWHVTLNRDGKERKVVVSHVVLCTGLGGGQPKMPAPFPGQDSFTGTINHSSKHGTGKDWTGKKALVVGACTSGHDISVDFAQNDVDVTMLQRSPTFVMSVKNGMPMMVGGLYGENTPPTDLADRIAESNPKHVAKLYHQRIIPVLADADKDLLQGLAKAGFKTTDGPDGSGFLMMALEKAGGYYFSTGGSEMIADGSIKVKQGEIAKFDGENVHFKDGSVEKYDVVVFATGYTGFPDTVKATIGEHWSTRFNPVWGLDEEGEIRGVARESGIPNLFFLVGNLSAARMSSKLLALQIKAQILGKFGERYTYKKQMQHVNGKTNGINGVNRRKETINGTGLVNGANGHAM